MTSRPTIALARARPIEVICARLHVVHGAPPKLRARCPAHGSHGGTLSVREGTDGAVLLRCHAGCAAVEVVHALGLELRDLFPNVDALRARQAERSVERRRFLKNPRETVRAALRRDLERVRQQIRDECGYARPLRSADVNAARARVSKIFDVKLQPIRPFVWECAPHDDDPAWPALFTRALRNELIAKWGDPDREPTASDLLTAAISAADDLHAIARDETA